MRKKLIIIIGVLAAALLIGMMSIPSLSSHETVPAAELGNFLALDALLEEHPNLIPGGEAEAVTVGSLWGSDTYYVLPCYVSVMNTVPQNGHASWRTALYLAVTSSVEDGQTEKLSGLEVRNLSVSVETEDDTMISTRVEIEPGSILYDTREETCVRPEGSFSCETNPVIRIGFLAATTVQARAENAKTQGAYVWNFDLYYRNKLIRSYRNVALTQEYVVNAT